jgi:hypothetical protein
MATPEGKIKLLTKAFLKLHNIPNWSIIPSAFGATTGLADIICITKTGLFVALEIKAEGKRKNVTANQQKFLDTITANNGYAIVISCAEDLAEFEAWLKYRELI